MCMCDILDGNIHTLATLYTKNTNDELLSNHVHTYTIILY